MTKAINKTTKNSHSYYNGVDETWVNGKPVRKYFGYPRKSPKSKNGIEPELLLQCAQILLKKGISQGEIGSILKKIGIEYDTWAIAKVITGNDLKTNKVFLRLK